MWLKEKNNKKAIQDSRTYNLKSLLHGIGAGGFYSGADGTVTINGGTVTANGDAE